MTAPDNAMRPVRLQRKRTMGFRLQDASPNGLTVVYVGRPTKWGNPFGRQYSHSPEECVRIYRWALLNPLSFAMAEVWQREGGDYSLLLGIAGPFLSELRGKNLACWCPLSSPCHADVLLEIANR